MDTNKSISYNVSFSRSSLFYYTGEHVTGTLYFHNKRKTFTCKKIFVELVGELGYTTKKTLLQRDGFCRYRNEQQTSHHQVSLIQMRQAIIYPKDTKNKTTLSPGEYSWPFKFDLPQGLPPSINPSQNSSLSINYYVRLVVDTPWFMKNSTRTYPLTIFPVVDLYTVAKGTQSVALARRNNQQLQFKVYLHHRGLLPGRSIILDVDIDNPQKLKIEKTEAILRQYQTVSGGDGHIETIFEMDVAELSNFNQTELHKTIHLPLSYSRLAPTCTHRVETNRSSITTEVSYELQLNAKIYGMSSEMKFTIPVIVGTESLREKVFSREDNENVDMPITYAEAMSERNLPPSYETVIGSVKSDVNNHVFSP